MKEKNERENKKSHECFDQDIHILNHKAFMAWSYTYEKINL